MIFKKKKKVGCKGGIFKLNFFMDSLRETLKAINGLNGGEITVKRIKQERKIKLRIDLRQIL